jgi:hypothetical protein
MKHICALAIALGLIAFGPESALAQSGSIHGFGSLAVDDLSSSRGSYGGTVAVNLIPGVQAIGELGRLGSVLPSTTDTLLTLAPVDVSVSALYGEGGIRLSPAPRSVISPYVEATAGVARLNIGVSGLGTTADVITNAALGLIPRTEPIAGLGGGVKLQGGPLSLDVGYRYKQIFGSNAIETVLGVGQELHAHQLRVGVGVRF